MIVTKITYKGILPYAIWMFIRMDHKEENFEVCLTDRVSTKCQDAIMNYSRGS